MSLDLSQIRRIVIVISFILLLFLGGTIYAVDKSKAELNARKVKITAFTVDAGALSALKKKYPEYTIKTSSEKRLVKVPDGYCLVLEVPNVSMAKSICGSLAQHRNIQAKGLEIAGKNVRIKKTYKKEADAKAAAQEIQKTASIKFDVKVKTKDAAKQGYKCVISDIPYLDSEDISEFMKNKKFVDMNEEDDESFE